VHRQNTKTRTEGLLTSRHECERLTSGWSMRIPLVNEWAGYTAELHLFRKELNTTSLWAAFCLTWSIWGNEVSCVYSFTQVMGCIAPLDCHTEKLCWSRLGDALTGVVKRIVVPFETLITIIHFSVTALGRWVRTPVWWKSLTCESWPCWTYFSRRGPNRQGAMAREECWHNRLNRTGAEKLSCTNRTLIYDVGCSGLGTVRRLWERVVAKRSGKRRGGGV